MKKIFMAVGALFAVVVMVLIIAGIIVYVTVDKAFIESRLASALHRHVTIEKIDVSLFSVISGIEIQSVAVSNFKTPEQLTGLQGKPVDKNDLFVRVDALRFKLKFLPLLRGRIDLQELVLQGPVISLVKNKQGGLNIDDLIKAPKQSAPPKKEEKKEPSQPFKADSLPVEIAVGEIGMKDATINYYDGRYDQNIQLYKLTALVSDIQIDPQDLANKNDMKLKFGMGLKSVGSLKSGGVQSFDVTLDANGKMIPFDLPSRELHPEVLLHINLPDGEISGLQLFNAVASIPLVGDYLGETISFLKGKQSWKGSSRSGVDLRYKAPQATLKNGKLELSEADLGFDGAVNIDSLALDMNVNVVMKKEINDTIKGQLAQKIEAAVKSPDVKKYISSGTLADTAMKPLLNREGRVELSAKVAGTTQKPDAKLTKPQLGSLGGIVKEAAAGAAVEAGKGAVKSLLKEDQQKVLQDVEGLLKKK